MNQDFSFLRKNYIKNKIFEKKIPKKPMKLFNNWFKEALNSKYLLEPNAVCLSTIDENNSPTSRIVLLKSFSNKGFVFFTNYKSKKGNNIKKNPKVCLSFFWQDTERQIIIKGNAKKINSKDSDIYFLKRPWKNCISSWSSKQSSIISSRKYIEKRYTYYKNYFKKKKLYRPNFWGGFLVKPYYIEFWQGRKNRLHDRISFSFIKNEKWKIDRLSP